MCHRGYLIIRVIPCIQRNEENWYAVPCFFLKTPKEGLFFILNLNWVFTMHKVSLFLNVEGTDLFTTLLLWNQMIIILIFFFLVWMFVMFMNYSGNYNKHTNLLFGEINMYETKNQYLSLINSWILWVILKHLRTCKFIETEKITIWTRWSKSITDTSYGDVLQKVFCILHFVD